MPPAHPDRGAQPVASEPGSREECASRWLLGVGRGALGVAEGQFCLCRLFLEPLQPLGFFTGSQEPFPVPSPQRPPLVTVLLCKRVLLRVRSPVLQMLICESLGPGGSLDA